MTQRLLQLALFAALFMGLTGCGQYQGWTRYECQLYENWQAPECNPPQCKAQGICTEDILGDDIATTAAP